MPGSERTTNRLGSAKRRVGYPRPISLGRGVTAPKQAIVGGEAQWLPSGVNLFLKGTTVKSISLAAGITLTEWSERTFYRKFSSGTLAREVKAGVSMIALDSIRAHLCIPLDSEELALLEKADAGDAESQNDLALIFLSHGKPKGAIYWLELAARQGCAEAMHWLGRCHIEGTGFVKNDNLGIMWLAKSAAHGHMISQQQMQGFHFPG